MSEYIVDVNDFSEMYAVEMGRYEELRELIRCKDCLYNLQIGTDMYCIHRQGIKVQISADDYCSRAEKEEEYYETD